MFSIDYKKIIEGAILASEQPLSIEQIGKIFENEALEVTAIKAYIDCISAEYQGRAIELIEVASGYRFQIRQEISPWIQKIWLERPTKYSRALLETLALIVYRQPITRAEIEDIRGVAVSTNIMKTLQERDWIKIIGYKEVPGKPALYVTTKQFLDDFNLKGLAELPPLAEMQSLETIESLLDFQAIERANNIKIEAINE